MFTVAVSAPDDASLVRAQPQSPSHKYLNHVRGWTVGVTFKSSLLRGPNAEQQTCLISVYLGILDSQRSKWRFYKSGRCSGLWQWIIASSNNKHTGQFTETNWYNFRTQATSGRRMHRHLRVLFFFPSLSLSHSRLHTRTGTHQWYRRCSATFRNQKSAAKRNISQISSVKKYMASFNNKSVNSWHNFITT